MYVHVTVKIPMLNRWMLCGHRITERIPTVTNADNILQK
jgi:hypothetical protein